MPLRIMVTGGAGFIGSHIVDAYVAAGHEVLVVDNLSTGQAGNVHKDARLIEMDITDPALVDLLDAERPDVVNHHAANPSVSLSVREPAFDATQNILGTLNLLEAACRAGVSRFIYISSGGAMYGDPQYLPIDEEHPSNPVSPYALSKHTGERYVRLYGLEHGLSWTSLRYANVYGPRQDPFGEAGVIAIFCQNLLDGVAPEIHWDGEQTRDFVYVGDCARANLMALEQGVGQSFNVGTGLGTSINALFRVLLEVAGQDVEPRRGPRRPGDARHSYLDTSKIERQLGWRAQVDLRQGLAQTWDYFGKVA
ncbi:MAG: NAD-dependent epimerase/dehydratase family protein [Anaerolineae bacterium]|nr:NAD-dependent epimerase/dehydratase family protein [Anaerolineae bacterium]